jgi:hypothetical protein
MDWKCLSQGADLEHLVDYQGSWLLNALRSILRDRLRYLTEFFEMSREPDNRTALDKRFGCGKRNSQAIPRTGSASKLIDNGEALVVDVPTNNQAESAGKNLRSSPTSI